MGFRLKPKEKRDLNLIARASFDLFNRFRERASKTQMVYWIRKYHKEEKQ